MTIKIGDFEVNRLGFGAMRITGEGIWGWPPDPDDAVALLRRVRDLGINLIDTADAYGPETSEYLIARALKPYDGLVIATKGGLERSGPREWHVVILEARIQPSPPVQATAPPARILALFRRRLVAWLGQGTTTSNVIVRLFSSSQTASTVAIIWREPLSQVPTRERLSMSSRLNSCLTPQAA